MNYKEYALALNANSQVISWISQTLANYLKSNPENQEEIEHIIDYLISPEAPQKNLTAMSYQDARKNTDKWVATLIKKGEHIKETTKDTEVVLDFKDGFKIFKLVGKNAYEREGYLMRHCVGSYYGNNKEIYSLRDKDNMPHCTMEKDQQVKGKGNGNIHPKYVGYVVKFLEHVGMTVGDSEMQHLGYINVERFKKDLSKNTKYFNDKYVPEDEKLLDVDGNEFASLDLLDVKPLIKEPFDGELKIGFNLEHFIKVSVDFIFKFSKKKDEKEKVGKVKKTVGYNSQNASSGNYSKNASSGENSQNASSGNYSKNASSGYNSQNASSGYNSQNASSGNYSKNASSGENSQNASSGNYSQNASSGYNSKNASSGYNSKNASSGENSKNASSGNYSKNASSGYNSQNASSGENSKNASSGNYSQNASSGENSKNASSGYNSQNASSGENSKNASSGENSKIEMSGKDNVGANIGVNGKIKGIIGNWITLAEYDENYKPLCVKSAKIDGVKLREDVWYILKNGKFTEEK